MTFIGFGEAAMAFATSGSRGYDIRLDDPATRASKLADFARHKAHACSGPAEALAGARVIFSLVTADQALAATRESAAYLEPGALWLDMNSVAPETKQAAAQAIEPHAHYLDIAVMAPVQPARLNVPLLISGPHAQSGAAALAEAGFSNARVVEGGVGVASAIKMIRSVMIKGIEALSAECALAAEAAGVRKDVIASLDASWPGANWEKRLDYNLGRMMVHGLRRAAEMDEVVKTLDSLGIGAHMTRGTVERQLAIGALHIPPQQGLLAKLESLLPFLIRREKAA